VVKPEKPLGVSDSRDWLCPQCGRSIAHSASICYCGRSRQEHAVMAANIGSISDGYHTFDELYAHRVALWKALCRVYAEFHRRCDDVVWRSLLHSDGSSYPGWFLLGMNYDRGEQITYHLPKAEWESCDFARTLDKAPEYDGHTSQDILHRIDALG
jgi:hypothetical protein